MSQDGPLKTHKTAAILYAGDNTNHKFNDKYKYLEQKIRTQEECAERTMWHTNTKYSNRIQHVPEYE